MNTTMKEVIALGAMAGITVTQPTKWRVAFKVSGEPYDAFMETVLTMRQKKTNRKRRWVIEGSSWQNVYPHKPLPNTSNVAIAAAHALQLVIAYLDAS